MTMNNAYALIVGIANYQVIRPLPQTVLKDARDIYDLLTDPEYCGYSPDHVQLLLDSQATKVAIIEALANLAQKSQEDSTVIVYFSSHGGQIEEGSYQGEYLLPVDTDSSCDESLVQTAISGNELTEALRAIPAQKLVVIFDCCHAGGIAQPKTATAPLLKAGLPESYYDVLKQGGGRVILASSRSSEESYIFGMLKTVCLPNIC